MFNHVCPHFPTQVLEILKLREEEEEAHTLTISIYDTKRNEKSKEYREAMVSPAPWLPPDPSPTHPSERKITGSFYRSAEATSENNYCFNYLLSPYKTGRL